MKLKQIRIKNNLLQNDVAKVLNVKRNTYAMWELEHDKIPLSKLMILAKYYNLSIDYILGLTEIEQYPNRMEFDKSRYLKRIKEVRKNNKVTQAYLASKLNTTNSVISRYEAGITFILTSFLVEYAIYFNISCDYLLGFIDEAINLKETKKLTT